MKKQRVYLSTIDPEAGSIARAQGLGVEIAEYCTASNMDEDFEEHHKKVLAEVQGVPRRILHGPFNELFPCAIDPKARRLAAQRYRQACGLAASYGADKVVIHAGFVPNVYYPCWYTEQSILFWREFLKDMRENRIICLENVMESDPAWMRDIVKEVDDPRLAICLDVGHANVCSRVPISGWLETLGPWIRHFHIHNNDSRADTHSSLGQGNIPIEDVLRQAQGLDASFTLEVTNGAVDIEWLRQKGLLEEEI